MFFIVPNFFISFTNQTDTYQNDNRLLTSFLCRESNNEDQSLFFEIDFSTPINCCKIDLIALENDIWSEKTEVMPIELDNCTFNVNYCYEFHSIIHQEPSDLVKMCCLKARKFFRLVFTKECESLTARLKFLQLLSQKTNYCEEKMLEIINNCLLSRKLILEVQKNIIKENTFFYFGICFNTTRNLKIEGSFNVQTPLLFYNGQKVTVVKETIDDCVKKLIDEPRIKTVDIETRDKIISEQSKPQFKIKVLKDIKSIDHFKEFFKNQIVKKTRFRFASLSFFKKKFISPPKKIVKYTTFLEKKGLLNNLNAFNKKSLLLKILITLIFANIIIFYLILQLARNLKN
ncbi:hypothetical protein NUSPORA_00003 [Nucleospora cyclopteri]